MGTTLEIWRARVGRWNRSGGRSSKKKKKGVGTLVLSNSVLQFFVVYGVLSIFNGLAKLKDRMQQTTTRHIVFLTATALSAAILTSLNLSAKTAEVSSKLMHDVETNPGPNCSGVSCLTESKSLTHHLLTRVDALQQVNLVSSLEFSTPTPVWILLKGFLPDQLTPSVVFNATSPPLPQQSKHSLTGNTRMLVAVG